MLTILARRPDRHNSRIPANSERPVATLPKAPPTLARLYARPGFLLRRAHQISAAVFEEACRDLGLTPAQFGVLTVLRSHPGLGQSTLARALGFDKVTVLRVLRGLEGRGLVARAPVAGNRRAMCVTLTRQGEQVLDEAQGPAEQAYRRLMGPLDRKQQQQLLQLLQLLTGGLEDAARASFVPPPSGASRRLA